MNLIEFFGTKVKPFMLRGKGICNSLSTQIIDENLSCIQQRDVNLWFYRKGNYIIAIDTGYRHFPNMQDLFRQIHIDPLDVNAVLLTHADMDHAGGVDDSCNLYPNATVYLHEKEEAMLLGKEARFKKGCIKIKNPIKHTTNYVLLKDRQVTHLGDIKVELIFVPGHTKGHSVYIIDDQILFSGDCIAVNNNGGYGFFHFYNMDTKKNMESINRLKDICKDYPIRAFCTGHSGLRKNKVDFFKHIDSIAKGSRKHPFDPKAPKRF